MCVDYRERIQGQGLQMHGTMRILTLLLSVLCYCFISSPAYRDGAREESCYNHSIVHERAFINTCGAGCRFFLTVKEVVNETTLELGDETASYECGKVYGSKWISIQPTDSDSYLWLYLLI